MFMHNTDQSGLKFRSHSQMRRCMQMFQLVNALGTCLLVLLCKCYADVI